MIKCVVFDWDGTLVDTIPFLEETFKATFNYLKQNEISYKEISKLAGGCNGQGLFKAVFGEENSEKAKKYFYDYTSKHHLDRLKSRNYAEACIKYCFDKGVSCYILSNKKNDVLRKEVEYFGWDKYFTKISGAGDYCIDKPSKEACLNFFNQNIPEGNEILVLGDSICDIKMAEALGCKCALLHNQEGIGAVNADYKLKSLEEFIPLLQSMLY